MTGKPHFDSRQGKTPPNPDQLWSPRAGEVGRTNAIAKYI